MKKPMKKIKPRRFAEGGNTFSPEQEKFLGGADRTDPYILARMRKAVPDQAPVEDRIPTPVNQIKDEDSFEQVIKNAAVNDDGQVLETANKGEDLAISLRDANIQKRMRDADNAPKAKKQEAPTAGSRGSVKTPYSNEGRNSKLAPESIQRGRGGPTADEFDRYAAEQKAQREAAYKKEVDEAATSEAKARFKKREEEQALQNVYPEQFLGGVGIKTIARLAKAAAERIGGKRVLNTISQDAIGVSKPLAIGGPRAIEGANAIKNGGDDFVMYKKGGQVKKMAFGGSVSSRGDGIAQRGKTRGKMC